MQRILDKLEEELLDNIISEPGAEYILENKNAAITYINPFRDKFFKKIFASKIRCHLF